MTATGGAMKGRGGSKMKWWIGTTMAMGMLAIATTFYSLPGSLRDQLPNPAAAARTRYSFNSAAIPLGGSMLQPGTPPLNVSKGPTLPTRDADRRRGSPTDAQSVQLFGSSGGTRYRRGPTESTEQRKLGKMRETNRKLLTEKCPHAAGGDAPSGGDGTAGVDMGCGFGVPPLTVRSAETLKPLTSRPLNP